MYHPGKMIDASIDFPARGGMKIISRSISPLTRASK
jgi:hypothetical protein